jgi:transposase
MGPDLVSTAQRDSTRRYTAAQKEQALRLVRELRAELGRKHGTVLKVAAQLGFGRETVRAWVREADSHDAGRSDQEAAAQRIAELEQEVQYLKSQNALLRQSTHVDRGPEGYDLFAAEYPRPHAADPTDLAGPSHRERLGRAG